MAVTKILCYGVKVRVRGDIILCYRSVVLSLRAIVTRVTFSKKKKKKKKERKKKWWEKNIYETNSQDYVCFLSNARELRLNYARESFVVNRRRDQQTDECVFYRRRSSYSGDRNLFWLSCVTRGWVAEFPVLLVPPLLEESCVSTLGRNSLCRCHHWIFSRNKYRFGINAIYSMKWIQNLYE